MIVVFVVISVVGVVGLTAYVLGLKHKVDYIERRLDDTRVNSASTHAMRALNEEIQELRKRVDELPNADAELEKVLEKKWEDAIQTISNFDPFKLGDNE